MMKKDDKRTQHSIYHGKLHKRSNKKNHGRKEQRRKKTLNKISMYIMTTPREETTAEETNDEEETTIRRQYVNYISKVAHALIEERGVIVPPEQLDKDIDDMVKFQIKLTKLKKASIDPSGGIYSCTLDELQEMYDESSETVNGQIDWIYKITALFSEASVSVDDDLDIFLTSINYFNDFVSLLDETSSRTIVNYIHWRFINRMITATTNEMRKIYNTWDNSKSDRSSVCKKKEMNSILAYEYLKANFSQKTVMTASDMLDDIQKEIEYQIKESDWMDDDTKAFVLAKLVHMKRIIGYPDWYKNVTIVKHYFRGLLVGKSYYENKVSYDRYVRWKELRKIMANTVLTIDPLILNAFFEPLKNGLAVSAADFQSPFFDYDRPAFVNFGFIGFLLAHEVNHGFDNTGRSFDKSGKSVEWLSAMAKAYEKREECFVNQFDHYPVDKTSNTTIQNYGSQTISDNIADTMGLQAAFKAYRRRERECSKSDDALPGLDEFTNNQMLFLSSANLWCETVDPRTDIVKAAMVDEHSVARLRVIGSVSNSDDFAKAYDCPVGSPMNPKKKCNIWK